MRHTQITLRDGHLVPTLLTGFIGYVMEVIALLVDLGHPERIWYYFIHQNFTSFLLAIGLYVMIYAAIMLVEFAPVVFERFKLQKLAALLQRPPQPHQQPPPNQQLLLHL